MYSNEELKKLGAKELDEELKKITLELLKLRLALSSRQSKETSKLKLLRKYVARMKMYRHITK